MSKTVILAQALREKYPCMSMARIGELVGVSRERVRQLTADDRIKPPAKSKTTYTCIQCGGLIKTAGKLYCSPGCFHDYHHATLECEVCHKLFERRFSYLKRNLKHAGQTHIFCGRRCQGHWLASNYGWGHHA